VNLASLNECGDVAFVAGILLPVGSDEEPLHNGRTYAVGRGTVSTLFEVE
jgi:hypothetical protein